MSSWGEISDIYRKKYELGKDKLSKLEISPLLVLCIRRILSRSLEKKIFAPLVVVYYCLNRYEVVEWLGYRCPYSHYLNVKDTITGEDQDYILIRAKNYHGELMY